MKKHIITIIVATFCSITAQAQINWLTIEEAIRLQDSAPRTIMIDMYTDWCGWCKKMDAETFSNPSLAEYINRNFYPVKFNAETTDTIIFPEVDLKTGKLAKNKITYTNPNLGQRSPHLLAQSLLFGRMSYPTIVFIDFENNITPIPGYRDLTSLEPILVFYTERINKTCDFGEYIDCWNATFHPELDTTEAYISNVKWKSFDQALAAMKEKPKKLLIYVYSDWNTSSKLMSGGSFKENVIADYINENFYAVKIPYDFADTIRLAGNTFVNDRGEPQYPHQLTIALLQPDFRIPFFAIFDETGSYPLITQRGFSSYMTLEKILSYFNENIKDEKLQDYFNNYKSELRNKETKQ